MKNVQEVEEFWTAQAPTFDEYADHGLHDQTIRNAWFERLRSWMPDAPAVVADLGCGTGSLSILAAELGAAVWGIDVSPAMVDLAREKATAAGLAITFSVGDVSAPALDDGSVDAILCRHVLWTLPDPRTALRRWSDALREDGRLVLIEGVWSTEGPDDYTNGDFPWRAGVSASQLKPVVDELFAKVEHVPLSESTDLWGKQVDSERYALVATGQRRT